MCRLPTMRRAASPLVAFEVCVSAPVQVSSLRDERRSRRARRIDQVLQVFQVSILFRHSRQKSLKRTSYMKVLAIPARPA